MAEHRRPETDLVALRAFCAVAEGGSYAAAQAVLGVSQSTISERLARLEGAIGTRLCERGRRGFQLTQEGRELTIAADRLFAAVEDFRLRSSELGGRLSGRLAIGVVDNTITDPASPIVRTIERFESRDHDVEIDLRIGSPAQLEREILVGSCELGLVMSFAHLAGLDYERLYEEEHILCCGREHPLYAETNTRRLSAQLRQARIVTTPTFAANALGSVKTNRTSATVDNVEACAMLLLTGRYVGYLPAHFAARWLDVGALRELLPRRRQKFSIELVKRTVGERSRAARAFLSDLRSVAAEQKRM